jgi:cytochrome c biogenesis protein ResB
MRKDKGAGLVIILVGALVALILIVIIVMVVRKGPVTVAPQAKLDIIKKRPNADEMESIAETAQDAIDSLSKKSDDTQKQSESNK